MAYDSIGSTPAALSSYSLTLVDTRRACPGLVSCFAPAYPIASRESGDAKAGSRRSNRDREGRLAPSADIHTADLSTQKWSKRQRSELRQQSPPTTKENERVLSRPLA
jgi:hypothetical protein